MLNKLFIVMYSETELEWKVLIGKCQDQLASKWETNKIDIN